MYSSGIEESHLGNIHLQCTHRCISALDTNSHAMEVELEEVQEDCRHDGTWRWHAGYCVCDSQEFLSHQCKTPSSKRRL
jgi:hypothetical protein